MSVYRYVEAFAFSVSVLNGVYNDFPSISGKHGAALQSSLTELGSDRLLEHLPAENKAAFRDRVKAVTERAALLKITSNAMVKASTDFVQVCQGDGRRWQRILANEREIRQRLEDMVRTKELIYFRKLENIPP